MILLWLLACTDEGGSVGGASAADYAGPVGRVLEYADPTDETHLTQLTLVITETSWEFTDLAGDAVPLIRDLDAEGLKVGDELLLPAQLVPGRSEGGVTVGEFGDAEVYYGTFPDAVTVEVAQGSFAGPHTWARDVGPIALAWNGLWELVYYE